MKYISGIFCILLSMSVSCYGQAVDSLMYRIQFAHNSSLIELSRAENASVFSRFACDLDSLRKTPGVKILEMSASGCASWEGFFVNNMRLCDKRAQRVIDYIKTTTGEDVTRKGASPFVAEFMEIIQECTSEYKDTVLTILANGNGEEQKFTALKAIDGGRCWKWLDTEMFPRQRRVDVTVTYLAPEPQAAVVPAVLLFPGGTNDSSSAEASGTNPSPETAVAATANVSAADTTGRYFIAIKNNLVYDAALVANLGVEVGFAKHFSLDIPVTYSPYTVSRNYRMRTLSIQPELRYYLKKEWRGHFFGVHGNFAYYNVVTPFNTKTRYQDRDGEHPLYGGGISYGYSLPLGKESRWGFEFTIGVGYAYLDYDCFYNVDNGAWFAKDTKHYFGPDKLGVTVYYRILDKNRKKK